MKKLCLALLLSGFVGQAECASQSKPKSAKEDLALWEKVVQQHTRLGELLHTAPSSTDLPEEELVRMIMMNSADLAKAKQKVSDLSKLVGENPDAKAAKPSSTTNNPEGRLTREVIEQHKKLAEKTAHFQTTMLQNPKPAHLSAQEFAQLLATNERNLDSFKHTISKMEAQLAAQEQAKK